MKIDTDVPVKGKTFEELQEVLFNLDAEAALVGRPWKTRILDISKATVAWLKDQIDQQEGDTE